MDVGDGEERTPFSRGLFEEWDTGGYRSEQVEQFAQTGIFNIYTIIYVDDDIFE